jgi:hypothetical protein
VEQDRVEFRQLEQHIKKQWQGESKVPGPKLGWVFLTAQGGHPGGDQSHAAIRRWTAPRTTRIRIRGSMRHLSDKGDGIRGRIISSRQGNLGEWFAKKESVKTAVDAFTVEVGEHIDFVTDCRSSESHDTFYWHSTIYALDRKPGKKQKWDSRKDFHGPLPSPMTNWDRYAQSLLLTNEFIFVD